MLAVGFDDGSVRLVNEATGETRLNFQAEVMEHGFLTLEASPDGRTLATAGSKTCLLWDLVSGVELLCVQDETGKGAPCAMAFSPCSQRLATGFYDGEVIIWNTITGNEELRFLGHVVGNMNSHAEAMSFSMDGALLASGGTPFAHEPPDYSYIARIFVWNSR